MQNENVSGGDRRIDILNDLRDRVVRLEITHEDLIRSKIDHEETIDKLSLRDTELTIALTAISSGLNALRDQISNGLKLMAGSFTLMSTLVGGYWIYSHDLDAKYQPKISKIDGSQTEILGDTNESINDQLSKLNKLQYELEAIKKKRVIKASK